MAIPRHSWSICAAPFSRPEMKTCCRSSKPILRSAPTLSSGASLRSASSPLLTRRPAISRIREERYLAAILKKFVAKKLQPWQMIFPYEFYEERTGFEDETGRTVMSGRIRSAGTRTILCILSLRPACWRSLRNPTRPCRAATGNIDIINHKWFKPDPG